MEVDMDLRDMQDIKGKHVLMVFAFAMLIYSIMLEVTIPHLVAESNGMAIFDMRPLGYSVEEAMRLIKQMSSSGIDYYRVVQLPLDFVYPVLLGAFGAMSLGYFSKWVRIYNVYYVLPVMVTLFDYLENFGIYLMLSDLNSLLIIRLASLCSVIKSLSTTILMCYLLGVTVYVVCKKLLRKVRAHGI